MKSASLFLRVAGGSPKGYIRLIDVERWFVKRVQTGNELYLILGRPFPRVEQNGLLLALEILQFYSFYYFIIFVEYYIYLLFSDRNTYLFQQRRSIS
jgi:hypothetical protein